MALKLTKFDCLGDPSFRPTRAWGEKIRSDFAHRCGALVARDVYDMIMMDTMHMTRPYASYVPSLTSLDVSHPR